MLGASPIAHDNQPGRDADTRLKGHAGRGVLRVDSLEDRTAGAHGLLGIMLMGGRITEIDEHAVAQLLGDKSLKSRRHVGDHPMEGGD